MKTLDLGFDRFSNDKNIERYYSRLCAYATDKQNGFPDILKGDYINLPPVRVEKGDKRIKLYEDNKLVAMYKWNLSYNPTGIGLIMYDDESQSYETIFHHIDLDGYSSASMIYNTIFTAEFVEFNYDTEELKEKVVGLSNTYNRVAYVVDLSLTKDQLMIILNAYKKVFFIDHHGTSLSMIENVLNESKVKDDKLYYAIDTRFSATYLAYMLYRFDYMRENKCKEGNSLYASLVSVYDTKQDAKYPRAYEEGLKLNQYFNDIAVLKPDSSLFEDLWKLSPNKDKYELLDQVLDVGEQLLHLNKLKMEVLYKNEYKYIFKYNGFTIKCINGIGNSTRFCNDNELDIAMIGREKGSNHTITLSAYSDNPRVKEVDLGRVFRKYYRGGGHPGAAGFTATTSFNISLNYASFDNINLLHDIVNQLKTTYSNSKKGIYPYEEGAINRIEKFWYSIFYNVSVVIFYELFVNK